MKLNQKLSSIRHFGLNPNDWRICKKLKLSSDQFSVELEHKDDNGIRLKGLLRLTTVRPNERSLQIKSLDLIAL